MIGDFGQHTKHTHAFVIAANHLDHPISLLIASATRLAQTLGHRLNQLHPDDILLHVDWSHLPTTIQLLHAALALPSQAQTIDHVMAEAEPLWHACRWCQLQFTSISNLRRHETHAHGQTQLRSVSTRVSSFALHGLPTCCHCFESFSTWRQFQVHLERNCCKAVPDGHNLHHQLENMAHFQDAPEPMQVRHLSLLLSKPYGHRLLEIVTSSAWNELVELQTATKDLTKYCILCGTFHNRPQDLNLHFKTQHCHWFSNVQVKAAQLCRSQASNSPCRFCNKTFQRSHQCPVLTQMALLLVNLDLTGGRSGQLHPEVLVCAICREVSADQDALHHHLAQAHQLESCDWQPLRDMQGPDPVCAHCLSCFANTAAVRQHITMGQCRSFNPQRAPQLVPVKADWIRILESGEFHKLLEVPMSRMKLTLTCQQCHMSYQRSSDLALHLQSVHASLWQQSQRFHPLILQICQATDGCYCNPKTHAGGLSHTCPALRQLCMLAIRHGQDVLLPWQYDVEGLARILTTNQNGSCHAQDSAASDSTRLFQIVD